GAAGPNAPTGPNGPDADAEWSAAVDTSGGPTTRAVLLHRRLTLVNDLRGALESVRTTRTDLVAAHENVRIQIARLRAGIATTGDLQPDVATLKAMLEQAPVGA